MFAAKSSAGPKIENLRILVQLLKLLARLAAACAWAAQFRKKTIGGFLFAMYHWHDYASLMHLYIAWACMGC